jgi:hypothetical protein
MSNTPAGQLARAKVQWARWVIARSGDLFTATPRYGGRVLRASSLAELEAQLARAEWNGKATE